MNASNAQSVQIPISKKFKYITTPFLVAALIGISACGPKVNDSANASESEKADGLMIVDCLLPPQLRKIGQQATYLTARRPIKTTGSECEIRGGEYVAFDRASYSAALKTWLPMAKTGDANAQNNVGEINEKGLGVAPDYKAAAYWYKKSAEQNFSRAQINLGSLYEKGLGVEKNNVIALNWYRKASGLTADNLQYTSSLTSMTEAHKKEVLSLKQKLAQAKTKENEAKVLNDELALMRKQINANKEVASKNQLLIQQVKQLEKNLDLAEKKKADLYPIQQQIVALQGMVNVSIPLAANAKPSMEAPPSIEIIDPAIVLTRGGKTAMLKPVIKTQDIIGKISAPEGLKTLSINGEQQSVDKHDLFWVAVPISQQETPIMIRAEDKLGQKISLDFTLFSKRNIRNSPNLKSAKNQLGKDFKLGEYYAIIIGNNNYDYYDDLKTAITDAEETARILEEQYGYKTLVLKNASRYNILSTLNKVRQELTPDDNLLIYYAGHGEIDKKDNSGYWVPVDAKPGNTRNWISNSAISDVLGTIKAKHVMVVADSCYSGTLSSASIARSSTEAFSPEIHKEWVDIMATTPARMALTSGGVQPVIDSGGGKHSVFAKAFLDVLTENQGLLEGYSLYANILLKMKANTSKLDIDQVSNYAPIKHAGHEAGEFFFQRI